MATRANTILKPVLVEALLAFVSAPPHLFFALGAISDSIALACDGTETGVKRVAVTPEIAARMRAGEQVSPEEIEAAVAKMEREKEGGQGKSSAVKANPNVDQDWLPQGQSPGGKKGKRR